MLNIYYQGKTTLICQSLIILFAIGLFFHETSFAQDTILDYKISIKLKKATVNEALSQISEKTKYYFTFDEETINTDKIINVNLKNKKLKKCLDQILNDSALHFQVIDNHILIKRMELLGVEQNLLNDTLITTIELQGTVVDQKNGKPLAYAAVGVKNNNIGSITNAQGKFILKIPKELISENLCVSFIGYSNTCIPVEQAFNKNQVIKLYRNYISVQEVIIRGTDPKSIIRSANKNIKYNYSTKANYLTAFYRESVKQKDQVMFFSEAVLKVFKTPYTSPYGIDQIKILKSRVFRNVSKSKIIFY